MNYPHTFSATSPLLPPARHSNKRQKREISRCIGPYLGDRVERLQRLLKSQLDLGTFHSLTPCWSYPSPQSDGSGDQVFPHPHAMRQHHTSFFLLVYLWRLHGQLQRKYGPILDPNGMYGNTGYCASMLAWEMTHLIFQDIRLDLREPVNNSRARWYIGVTLGKRTQRSMKPKSMAFQRLNEAVMGKLSTSRRQWVISEEDSPPHTCH
ncbi:hypothetical protein EDB84DRAFT_1679658 [Lactarius hengduanensis]|nr:hypothetical protein EDB84DRAFT_1679658 [Lactarius hengduanensis]